MSARPDGPTSVSGACNHIPTQSATLGEEPTKEGKDGASD